MDIIKEEKKDFLLESEKKEIEVKLLEAISEKQEVDEKKEDIEKVSLKKTKATLIKEFIELQKTQSEILEYDETSLKRMTKAEIIKLIAAYAEKKIQANFPNDARASTAQSVGGLEELMAQGMCNINVSVMKMLEAAGHLMKSKTGDFNILENLSDEAESRREAFMVVFKQIYKDYQVEINKYMNPFVQYGVILTQCATTCAFKNITKKKDSSKEELNGV